MRPLRSAVETVRGAVPDAAGPGGAAAGRLDARASPAAPAAPQTFVAYLDVGDGDCTLIRTVSGETILLDTGSAAGGPCRASPAAAARAK